MTYLSQQPVSVLCDLAVTRKEVPLVDRYVVRTPEDLGRAIAEIRKLQHLTQAQLAEQGAMSRDSLAHLERGRQGRSIELLLRLLRRLGATVTITVGDHDGAA